MLEDEVDQSSLPEGADGLQGLTALRESPTFLLSQLHQSQTSKLHFEEERCFYESTDFTCSSLSRPSMLALFSQTSAALRNNFLAGLGPLPRAADLDWIVGPRYITGGYILGCSQRLTLVPPALSSDWT